MKIQYSVENKNCLTSIKVIKLDDKDVSEEGILEIPIPAIISGKKISSIGKTFAMGPTFFSIHDIFSKNLDCLERLSVIKFNMENGPSVIRNFSIEESAKVILHIPESVEILDDCCFSSVKDKDAIAFKELTFDENCKIDKIGAYAFQHCSFDNKFILPKKCKSIEQGGFSHCLFHKGFEIPEDSSLEKVETRAFCGSIILNENGCLSFSNRLQVLEGLAFSKCKGLEKINLSKSNKLLEVESKCFSQADVEEIDFGENTKVSIQNSCFEGTKYLKKVILSPFAVNIHPLAFKGLSVSDIKKVVTGANFVKFED